MLASVETVKILRQTEVSATPQFLYNFRENAQEKLENRLMKQNGFFRGWLRVFLPSQHSAKNRSRCRVARQSMTVGSYQSLETRQLLASDMVLEWNEVLLNAIRSTATPPPPASRAMAIVHTSIFNAVSSIENSYESYRESVPVAAHSKASIEAAVAAAAERTLSTLFPALQATFSQKLTDSLSTIEDGIRETQGVTCGRLAADQILAWRAADGAQTVVNYTPGTAPGEWRPTLPLFSPGAFPQWPSVTPWSLGSASQFRPIAPPTLNSPEYAAAFNEVKSLGAIDSTTRTSDQTEIARIWAGGGGTATPPGQWNMIAQDISRRNGYSLEKNARLFALLNIGLADAAIACWDAKYAFNLWRPITAIQLADTDANALTEKVDTWKPLIATPPFSAYPSGHSTFSGAASTILASFVGSDTQSFTLNSEVPGVADRSFTSIRAAAEEAGMSRIYGGIHFQFDNTEGLAIGRKIGALVASSLLPPVQSVTAVQDGTAVYVSGTRASDHLMVRLEGSNIIVTNRAKFIAQFSASNVNHFFINTGLGNDRLAFDSKVNATAEILAGGGNDKIFGTSRGNWIYGEGGNDKLCGGNASDLLRGGAGNDRLFGLGGDDALFGDEGENLMFGGSGDDTLTGKRKKNKMFGGSGSDTLNWL